MSDIDQSSGSEWRYLSRDLSGGSPAVELLVVAVGNGGILRISWSTDGAEEPEGVAHVTLDLKPFLFVQGALRDLELDVFVVGEERQGLAAFFQKPFFRGSRRGCGRNLCEHGTSLAVIMVLR